MFYLDFNRTIAALVLLPWELPSTEGALPPGERH